MTAKPADAPSGFFRSASGQSGSAPRCWDAYRLPPGAEQSGDVWWHHHADSLTLLKTMVSPLVTSSVALLSATATWVEKQRSLNTAP